MPSHIPTELKLDAPIDEEDIGDLSPYSVPLFNLRTTNSNSSRLTPSSTLLNGNRISGPSKNLDGEPRRLQVEISSLTLDSVTKLRRWILAFAVVEFDVDTGPTVDNLYPPLKLHPTETETLSFCAFPDSVQFDQGFQTHSFRIREQSTIPLDNRNRPLSNDGYIYGFSYFTRKKDSTLKRGYQQRSLVILTQHQFPSLFSCIISQLGPRFETHGTPMLEAACDNIAKWPDPSRLVELGFLGSVLRVEIPHSADAGQMAETPFIGAYDPVTQILATTAPLVPPPLSLFESALSNLWSIWECLVLCEPILVFGVSAAQTSQAIWWMRDLLGPIPPAADFRPYFTVQDGDSSLLVNKLPPKPGLLLGVTNPFFEKACLHWPHMLSLGRKTAGPSKQHTPMLGRSAGPSPGWNTRTHKRYISKDRALLKQLEDSIKRDDRAQVEASLALRRHFCSRSAQVIAPVARYLNTLIPSPAEVQRVRGLSPFLSPSPTPPRFTIPSSSTTPSLATSASQSSLSSSSNSHSPARSVRHLRPPSSVSGGSPLLSSAPSPRLTPTHGQAATSIRPSSSALRLKPFNNANFFISLKTYGSVLPFKSSSKRTEFYQRWLKSPAFGTWLAQQEQIVQTFLNDPPVSAK